MFAALCLCCVCVCVCWWVDEHRSANFDNADAACHRAGLFRRSCGAWRTYQQTPWQYRIGEAPSYSFKTPQQSLTRPRGEGRAGSASGGADHQPDLGGLRQEGTLGKELSTASPTAGVVLTLVTLVGGLSRGVLLERFGWTIGRGSCWVTGVTKCSMGRRQTHASQIAEPACLFRGSRWPMARSSATWACASLASPRAPCEALHLLNVGQARIRSFCRVDSKAVPIEPTQTLEWSERSSVSARR